MSLPGDPPPVLAKAMAQHSKERREAFMAHLLGGTSADFLSAWLKEAGTPVGAATLKLYRRSLAND